LNKFVQYLSENVPMYLETSAIRCVFDVPTTIPDFPLSSEMRHNLFLVVKEALHNMVKHAQASEARVGLRIDNETLFLSLADNGKGFPMKKKSAFGNGLLNMQERMKKIGGHFDLESDPGKGTRILLKIPLRKEFTTK
ncbi:MAG: ATP-binding protein, partial [Verrucomicrobiota bacterium]|nr:ATP-binding protein [Verrucomicrobiota bacterium]